MTEYVSHRLTLTLSESAMFHFAQLIFHKLLVLNTEGWIQGEIMLISLNCLYMIYMVRETDEMWCKVCTLTIWVNKCVNTFIHNIREIDVIEQTVHSILLVELQNTQLSCDGIVMLSTNYTLRFSKGDVHVHEGPRDCPCAAQNEWLRRLFTLTVPVKQMCEHIRPCGLSV